VALALPPASRRGHNIRGQIHRDMHAFRFLSALLVCGGRSAPGISLAAKIRRGGIRALETPLCFSRLGSVSVVLNAKAFTICHTPADVAADLAFGGSGHADTINSYPTRAARCADLCDHAVRLMKRRRRHGLRTCCDGQRTNKSNQPDHWFSLLGRFLGISIHFRSLFS
jgi:hypothetical protein